MTTTITDAQLLARLADAEDNYTERKSDGVKDEEIRRTVCAFSNSLTAGATAVLFIGVHDRTGEIVGVANSDALQKRVRDAVERCYPPITNFTCRVLKKDHKAIVAVKVGSSNNRPHFTGPAYVRRGSESVAASDAMFADLVASRNGKTARILQMRDQIVTIRGLRHHQPPLFVPGSPGYIEDAAATMEGRITDCDAHTVRLETLATGERITQPLDNIQISYDEAKYRPLLIVRQTP